MFHAVLCFLKRHYKLFFIKLLYFFLLFPLFFLGCSRSIPTPEERYDIANRVTTNKYKNHVFTTSNFSLFSYFSMNQCDSSIMNVYIEGDGLAWITKRRASDNPTPINPIALKLFNTDIATCKIYLARPCQFIADAKCTKSSWTSHRFSQEVVASYDEVLDVLKKESNVTSFVLIGYSGGGAIATLLGAKRKDIDSIVTVAGNLDTKKWAEIHSIKPLSGSLNPSDYTNLLLGIKQIHFVGGRDEIVPKAVSDSFIYRFSDADKKNITQKVVTSFTHSEAWEEDWNNLFYQ